MKPSTPEICSLNSVDFMSWDDLYFLKFKFPAHIHRNSTHMTGVFTHATIVSCLFIWAEIERCQLSHNPRRLDCKIVCLCQQRFAYTYGINFVKTVPEVHSVNSSPSGQNGHHLADDIFICIFENNFFSLKFHWSLFLMGPIDNNPAMV